MAHLKGVRRDAERGGRDDRAPKSPGPALDEDLGSAGVLARRGRRSVGHILKSITLALLSALLLFCRPAAASAAPPDAAPAAAPPPAAAISPEQLSQSIDQVLQKREFAWRMPREQPVESDAPQSWLGRALDSLRDFMRDAVKAVFRGLGKVLNWIIETLLDLWPGNFSKHTGMSGWSSGLLYSLQILLLLLISVLVGVLVVLIVRAVRRRRRHDIVLAEPVAARPDLSDENVAADQLPEDGWLNLARQMMDDGNLRLALRAFYLASLAHLAAREMISIAIFKSNREYETELRRRARAVPEVQNAFSQNVAVFDWAWYGLHEVTQDALQQFQFNLARIRSC
jgi:hypothetical protein